MKNNLILNSEIKNKIHSIRGLQVLLDKDLAELYCVKAIRLREQVKRNSKRFPSDFCFRLSSKEVDFLVSQNAIPSRKYLGGHLPFAFTEQGVASLSSILNSNKAIEVNIKIIRAFIAMRKLIATNSQVFQRLDRLEVKQLEHDDKFNKVFDAIESKGLKPEKGIFFDGDRKSVV